MNNFWELLELEPTQDVGAIKRAYAQKARECHPEEDPEGFLRLRQAYQAALDYAEGRASDKRLPTSDGAGSDDGSDESLPTSDETEAEDVGWSLREGESETVQNPYRDCEAIRTFVDLYTGKQRKNPKLWMDYFTSDAFLDVGWESQFTALLLEKVTEVEETCPPNQAFMTWLSIAYQFTVAEGRRIDPETQQIVRGERRVTFAPGAEFDGMESVARIARRGPIPKNRRGNEFAILQSFQDYRHLIHLAEAGRWDTSVLEAFRNIVNRYSPSYIRERCEQRVTPDCERHPAGLRVFIHFFRRDDLPETVYRAVWQKLDLRSAIMGRAKVLYGPLRELVLKRVPGIGLEMPKTFLPLNQGLTAYLKQIRAQPSDEETLSAAFFDRPDLQEALVNPRFVEKELLTWTPWRREGMGEGLIRRLLEFYREHPEVPRSGEVAAELRKDLRRRVVKRWNLEDADAEAFPLSRTLTLRYRPFFRHWLNTGFYTARDPGSGKALLDYLEKYLPYQKAWSRRFAGTVVMGEVEVDFQPLHMAFRVDGQPVYRPCLDWERTAACPNDDWFFFRLPITMAPYRLFDEVAGVIADRLSSTAAPEEDRETIARYLAGAVCSLPTDESTGAPMPSLLSQEQYGEGGGQLYVCVWREDSAEVSLCQQTFSGRRVKQRYQLEPGESPEEAARRLLAEAVSPTQFDLSRLKKLPWDIWFPSRRGTEIHLERPDLAEPAPRQEQGQLPAEAEPAPRGEGKPAPESLPPVTAERLSELLLRFGRDELDRLEMSWFSNRLVLRRDGDKYACLYFEQEWQTDYCYKLLADAGLYRTVECEDVEYVPFGMGLLPTYAVFDDVGALMGRMDTVLSQMARGKLESGGPGGWIWCCDVHLHDAHHHLLMEQQKLGGISEHRGRNHLSAKFVLSRYPVQLETEDSAGGRTVEPLRSGTYGRAADGLVRFMMGKAEPAPRLVRVRLTWDYRGAGSAKAGYQRHMVLLRDGEQYMLIWLRDDQRRADVRESGELLHIRNVVDLLLDDIDRTDVVVDRSGAFLRIDRPYEEIRAALVREE